MKFNKHQKSELYKNIGNGCRHKNFDYIFSFDTNGNITSIKITHNNIDYIISDIIIMGVSLLFKETSTGSSALWDIRKLFDFIEKNNK